MRIRRLNDELKLAIEAAIEAGNEILKVYEGEFSHVLKTDGSPITMADRNANEVINAHLKKSKIPIISEENEEIGFAIRKTWNRCWIVDPLDGTKEFMKRNGEFTVNIALVEDGAPVLGVVYAPVTKTIYFADVEKNESFKYELAENIASVENILDSAKQLRKQEGAKASVRVIGSRSHMNQETKAFIENLKNTYENVEIVSRGSSLKFCLVAEGEADIYPRFAPTMEWDTAAAQAVCRAAGVSVISQETQKELRYNKNDFRNPWFICQ